ncbi:MAG TPA: HAD-IIIC family phosphatase [candidate division Zixibacteria bacterium]|nr:HAD-IIIC family phosphatase [candidate division Zixibacteria bacterium]
MEVLFLGNYTQDLVSDTFRNLTKEQNMDVNVTTAGFNQYRQEIINPVSQLYQLSPEVVFLSIDLFTFSEDIIYLNDNNKTTLFKERIDDVIKLLHILKTNLPGAQVFVDNFFYFRPTTMATIEYNSRYSFLQFETIANMMLNEAVKESGNLKIVDVKGLVLRKGAENLFDERLYYLAKSHWSQTGLKELAGLYLRYFKAFKGIRKKCIVVDLDNTLWGGIIGDDGMENIKLSNDGDGKAFYDFQRELLKLYNRGILLAINSKNTKEIVIETMEKHPYMILKPDHFISMKINWNNKAQNMKEIADEINIGLDSLVFLDDSEFEREVIINKFPEVYTPALPKDFSEYPNFIRQLDVFDFLSLTGDDFARNKMYKANVQRDNLKMNVVNIEDFYCSLEMKATVDSITPFQVPRIAQMTQKTNQFNLRTQRYTESEIKRFMEDSGYEVYFLSLADKFGDNGIVGTAIIKLDGEKAFIDSFIFSCRALGRTAETALLNYIVEDVKEKGLKKLIGEYIPTKKNMPCKDFYKEHGFRKEENGMWIINVKEYEPKQIPWIKVVN